MTTITAPDGKHSWPVLVFSFFVMIIFPSVTFPMGGSPPKETPDAIILLLEKNYQVDQDGNYTVKVHIKTRIITYQGKKSWADFKITYNSNFEKIKVIQACTVTAQGQKISVTPREIHDITDPSTQSASLFSTSRLKVVNFPSVEEGCTVEMTLEKSSRLGLWAIEPFSLKDPIRLKRVRVSMPATMDLTFHLKTKDILQRQEILGSEKIYTWTGKDRCKITLEPMMPPIQNRPDTLIFSTLHSWQDVSKLFKQLLPKSRETQNSITQATDLLKKEKPEDIFVALKKRLEIYPIGLFRSNLSFSPPGKTLARGYGTQLDMILLFRYLLKLKNIENHIVAVNSAGIWLEGLKDCYNPSFFNTFLLKVRDKFYSFDMKYAGPGITGLEGSIGLDIDRATFVSIKDAVKNKASEEFNLAFNTPSSFTSDYIGKYIGLKSVSTKGNFKDLTPSEFQVKQSIYYHSLHPDAKPLAPLKVTGTDLESLETDIRGRYKVENFKLENHGILFFPVRSPGILNAFFAMLPERKNPIFIRRSLKQSVSIKALIPPDVTVEHLPLNTSGSIGPFSWESGCTLKGRNLLCQKAVYVKRGFIKAGPEYQKVRNMVQALMEPWNNSVVFQQTGP